TASQPRDHRQGEPDGERDGNGVTGTRLDPLRKVRERDLPPHRPLEVLERILEPGPARFATGGQIAPGG
ncbi:MAG: hypothetical protein KC656_24440, partial [Myxococcales bacterium]|nr:hypothetical protein [Myxococcales bacterium]